MPRVQATVQINAPLEQVYLLAKNIEDFPAFMPDVEQVSIVEQRPDGTQVSHWVAAVKELNRKIVWTEEDYWDDAAHLCTFRQTEGDFGVYQGQWRFTRSGDSITVQLELDYEYDVPLIGSLIKGLLRRKMQENVENMLAAIKEQAEGD